MNNLHRTSRIAFRCSKTEREHIDKIALNLGLSVADLFRQSTVIALSKTSDLTSWRRAYTKAIKDVSETKLWTTS